MQANLEWFRTFKAIYEVGTMSGAAKKLYISQPGIGLHLNALETYTGYTLFERTARKMIPTERGHLLYQQMYQSLSGLEAIESRFRRKSGEERSTLSVGMCVETFQQALEKHIPDLDFNLIMQFGDHDKLIELLENGAADLILTTKVKESPNLEYIPFTVERLVLVAGRQTDLSGFKALDLQDKEAVQAWLKSQLWYNTASDMKLLNQFWENNFGRQPDFVPNYIVPNKFSIARCLSKGKGLAVLPDFILMEAVDQGQLTRLWDGYTPSENRIYFGRRQNALHRKQIAYLQQLLLQEFEEPVPVGNIPAAILQ